MDCLSPAACTILGSIRLLELRLSRRNERALGLDQRRSLAGSSFPLMVATNVLLFALPMIEGQTGKPQRGLGGFLLVTALALRWWCIRSLGLQWNVRAAMPERFRVIDRGPYRYVRHPNYLAVMLEFAALPLFCGAYRSLFGLSAANGLLLWHRIGAEEDALATVPEYRLKMGSKARFLPGLI